MEFKCWQCIVCGFIYNEEFGLPDEGIPPGTKWEDVPDSWFCADCGAIKSEFEMVQLVY
jgi:rubredoxin